MSAKEQCIQIIETLTESELVHLNGIISCYIDAILERRRADALDEAIAKAEASGYSEPFSTVEELMTDLMAEDDDDEAGN